MREGGHRHVSGATLLARYGAKNVSGLPVRVRDLFDVPSPSIGLQQMLVLAREIAAARADETVAGVAVTHGSATLEEAAFFVDLVFEPEKPIVFTGALL